MKLAYLIVAVIPMVTTGAYAKAITSPVVEVNRTVVIGADTGGFESEAVPAAAAGLTNCVVQINQPNGGYARVNVGAVSKGECQTTSNTLAAANR